MFYLLKSGNNSRGSKAANGRVLTWIALQVLKVNVGEVVPLEIHPYPYLLLTAIHFVVNWNRNQWNLIRIIIIIVIIIIIIIVIIRCRLN